MTALAVALLLAADAGPAWVSGATCAPPALNGVGRADTGGRAMRRSIADTRARAEIGKQLDDLERRIFPKRDPAFHPNDWGEPGEIEQAVKAALRVSLSGVEIVDHRQGDDGEVIALATLPLDALLRSYDQAKVLSQKVRASLVEETRRWLTDACH